LSSANSCSIPSRPGPDDDQIMLPVPAQSIGLSPPNRCQRFVGVAEPQQA
jgi:hypothetical protein